MNAINPRCIPRIRIFPGRYRLQPRRGVADAPIDSLDDDHNLFSIETQGIRELALRVSRIGREDPAMTNTAALMERNRTIAESHDGTVLPPLPKYRAVILACADGRADPTHIMGLEPGDAVVIRNTGARVTQQVLEEVARRLPAPVLPGRL